MITKDRTLAPVRVIRHRTRSTRERAATITQLKDAAYAHMLAAREAERTDDYAKWASIHYWLCEQLHESEVA